MASPPRAARPAAAWAQLPAACLSRVFSSTPELCELSARQASSGGKARLGCREASLLLLVWCCPDPASPLLLTPCRVQAQAVCRGWAAALDAAHAPEELAPCSLTLRPGSRAQLEWVIARRPAVARVRVAGPAPAWDAEEAELLSEALDYMPNKGGVLHLDSCLPGAPLELEGFARLRSLALCVEGDADGGGADALLQLARLPALRSLALEFSGEGVCFAQPLTALTSLRLAAAGAAGSAEPPCLVLNLDHLPALERLSLGLSGSAGRGGTGLQVEARGAAAHLTCLELAAVPHGWEDVFADLPCLQRLRLAGAGGDAAAPAAARAALAALPRLARLELVEVHPTSAAAVLDSVNWSRCRALGLSSAGYVQGGPAPLHAAWADCAAALGRARPAVLYLRAGRRELFPPPSSVVWGGLQACYLEAEGCELPAVRRASILQKHAPCPGCLPAYMRATACARSPRLFSLILPFPLPLLPSSPAAACSSLRPGSSRCCSCTRQSPAPPATRRCPGSRPVHLAAPAWPTSCSAAPPGLMAAGRRRAEERQRRRARQVATLQRRRPCRRP